MAFGEMNLRSDDHISKKPILDIDPSKIPKKDRTPEEIDLDNHVTDKNWTNIKDNPDLQALLGDLYKDYETQSDTESASESAKYSAFRDSDSPIIYDVDEERAQQLEEEELKELKILELSEMGLTELEEEAGERDIRPMLDPRFSGLNLKRGHQAVFELEDLVKALKKEKCSDLLVIRVDPQLAYVDHLVVATCRTPRHLRAVAEFVKKLYKLKMDRSAGDVVPKLEGLEGKSEWIAMDLATIALHLFTESERRHYNIESLWIFGPEIDALHRVDPLDEIMANHDFDLDDLEPSRR